MNRCLVVFLFLGAVGHHGDNLVEKIMSVLKPLPGHVTDVQVDMLELTSLQRTPHSQTTLAPGCLAQTQRVALEWWLVDSYIPCYVQWCFNVL